MPIDFQIVQQQFLPLHVYRVPLAGDTYQEYSYFKRDYFKEIKQLYEKCSRIFGGAMLTFVPEAGR